MNDRIRLAFATAVSCALLLIAGCSEDTGPLDPRDASPAADAADTAPPDAGIAPDAGAPADASAPDATPPRKLVDVPLFGEMPPANRVHDPEFDLWAAAWFGIPLDGTAQQYALLVRHAFAETPTGQPVLTLRKAPHNPNAVAAIGNAIGLDRPLEASVHLGRVNGAPETAEPSILALTADGQDVAYDLSPAGDAVKLGEITWQRFSVRIDEPTAGWLLFFIGDRTIDALMITGPTVVEAPRRRVLGAPAAHARAPSSAERRATTRFMERQRDQLRAPRGDPLRTPARDPLRAPPRDPLRAPRRERGKLPHNSAPWSPL
ncbi:MAG: hypothetical protein IT384_00435 [Deltaproteobacteria bacterium]|nr:hypothetical protein [Deltaproteobacteria bacterium]